MRALALSFALTLLPTVALAQGGSVDVVVSDEATADATVAPSPSTPPPPTVPPPPSSGPGPLLVGRSASPPPPASVVVSPYVTPAPAVYTPPEPTVRRHVNWALLGSGIGLLAGGWVLTFVSTSVWYDQTTACSSTGWFSYSCTHTGPGGTALAWSFLPVVGPWLMLTDSYMDTAGEIAFPIIAGLVQDTGLILLILGAILREEEYVEAPRAAGDVQFHGGASAQGFFGSMDLVF